MRSLALTVASASLACACSGSPSPAPPDYAFAEPPSSTVPSTGVRRELFWVDGVVAPPNPTTSDATPTSMNRTRVVRYRQDVDPAVPPRAILIAMPGFLGGGPSFDGLARALVLRGGSSGLAMEVWAIDRRSNQLEDLRGMDTAEATGDPQIARDYYFGGATIDGTPFPGYLAQSEVGYMSEWGLPVHFGDLRAVIELVPAADRIGHLFLMGHSLGSAMTEAYAAWRFEDGVRGVEDLAGLVMIDGILGDAPISEGDYTDGYGGLFGNPGLAAIRTSTRYATLPLLGIDVYAQAEYLALRSMVDPTDFLDDPVADSTFSVILGLPVESVPTFTYRAALGVGFDAQFQPLSFVRVNAGTLTGGAVTDYTSFLGDALQHPSDPTATYDWVDALAASPVEYTPLENMALAFTHGQSNFAEWYFPNRLSLDVAAVGGAAVPEGAAGYQAQYGLYAYDGALDDAPILCIPAGLVGDVAQCEQVRNRVAPAVGGGRVQDGQSRGTGSTPGFRVTDATALAHLDPVLGADTDANPVPAAIEAFVSENVAGGSVTLTLP